MAPRLETRARMDQTASLVGRPRSQRDTTTENNMMSCDRAGILRSWVHRLWSLLPAIDLTLLVPTVLVLPDVAREVTDYGWRLELLWLLIPFGGYWAFAKFITLVFAPRRKQRQESWASYLTEQCAVWITAFFWFGLAWLYTWFDPRYYLPGLTP